MIKFKTNHVLRNLSVLAQRNGLQRWTAKTVFSSIKRTFDIEYVFILSFLKKYGPEMMLIQSLIAAWILWTNLDHVLEAFLKERPLK